MAKFERYDARDDAFFDGGEIEDDEEGSRLPLLLVIGLLVVAAFAGVVWLAYTQGVQRGRADAPRMLVAANGPVKEAPANAGGSDTPYKGLKIYQQPAPADDEDTESPQPPTPAATPAKAPVKAAAPVKVAATHVAAPPPRPVAATDFEALPIVPATQPPRALHQAAASSVPALKPSTAAAPPPAKAAQPASAQPAPVAPAQTASIPSAPAAAAGSVALQIGAYKSEEEANASWTTFSHKHPMATAYQMEVRKVDLGAKGVWYRLRLGSFVDKTEAVAFCDKLKADGGTCFLAK
jgi:hypothetical protein